MNISFSWRTKKVGTQYEFIVTKNVSRKTPNANGQYIDSEIVKTGTYKTRAIAKNRGQKWAKYLRFTETKGA